MAKRVVGKRTERARQPSAVRQWPVVLPDFTVCPSTRREDGSSQAPLPGSRRDDVLVPRPGWNRLDKHLR